MATDVSEERIRSIFSIRTLQCVANQTNTTDIFRVTPLSYVRQRQSVPQRFRQWQSDQRLERLITRCDAVPVSRGSTGFVEIELLAFHHRKELSLSRSDCLYLRGKYTEESSTHNLIATRQYTSSTLDINMFKLATGLHIYPERNGRSFFLEP